MAGNMSILVGDDFNEDCLSEIFSYLSIDNMIQVKNVCKKWRQVSEQWFKRVQALGFESNGSGTFGRWKLQENHFKRELASGHNIKHLVPILRSCRHHIKYYKVEYDEREGDINTKREKFVFQLVPILCNNIVDVTIIRFGELPSLTFDVMSTHWNKLEKIYIRTLAQSTKEDIIKLLHNNKKLKTFTLRSIFNPSGPIDDIIFTYLPPTIEEIEINCMSISDKKQLRHFIAESKNFTSLRSLKFFDFDYLSDAVVMAIANIKSLTHLTLSNVHCYESRRTIYPIVNLENLKSLVLSENSDLHDDNLINIFGSFKQLERLDIYNENMSIDKGMMAIAELKQLKVLSIDASNISSESIIDLPDSLEILDCSTSGMNNSYAIKLLKKGTNLKLVDFTCCEYLTKDLIEAAIKIADERKNILCIIGNYEVFRVRKLDTPYFKYYEDCDNIPLGIFPKDMISRLKEIFIHYKFI